MSCKLLLFSPPAQTNHTRAPSSRGEKPLQTARKSDVEGGGIDASPSGREGCLDLPGKKIGSYSNFFAVEDSQGASSNLDTPRDGVLRGALKSAAGFGRGGVACA